MLLAPIYSLAGLHTSKPFAYTLHDLQEHNYPENFSGWQRNWRYQVHAGLLARACRVICESQHVKADIIGSFGVPAERTAVITAPPQLQFLTGGGGRLQAVVTVCSLPASFLILSCPVLGL